MRKWVMKKEHTDYYSLRYRESDSLHKAGERIVACKNIVRIGQQPDCEVHIPNESSYVDELFAIIRPCSHIMGWQLIPMSDFVRVKVNGTEVTMVHYLSDGDRITFDESSQELLFNVRKDNLYNPDMGIVKVSPPLSRRIIALFVLFPILLFGILWNENKKVENEEKRREELLLDAKNSVWQLSVDSVFYVEKTASGSRVLKHFSYIASEGKAINGTAFMTTDSFLYTARHCIEPWLNDGEIIKGIPSSIKSIPTKWALEAETYNQTHNNDTIYKVVSLCTLSRGEHATEQLTRKWKSSDFIYDVTRDEIIDMGDFNHEYYWRSIRRKPSRNDMMFGDLAYIPFVDKGVIAVASEKDMEELVKERNSLYFMGYPEYQVPGFEYSEGKVKRRYDSTEMIAHDGRLVHGYSGGPALAIKEDSIYVVGIISVIDSKGGDRMYSVPITKRKKGGMSDE